MKRREGLATLEEAVRWIDKHWSEQPAPPIRLHQAGVEPQSQLGAPRTAAVFWRYLTVDGDAIESVSVTEVCYHPRLPQEADGTLRGVLCVCAEPSCERLHCPDCMGFGTRTKTQDRFTYPMRCALDAISREPKWYAVVLALARSQWDHAKAGIPADRALTAIRKVHSRYSRTPVARPKWTELSESQQRAEVAA